MYSHEQIRSCFPSLAAVDDVLLDNAGGSQVPGQVADAIHRYMLGTYVQLGADYRTSQTCTSLVERAHEFVALLMNDLARGKVILGSSTTALCSMLARCYAQAPDRDRTEIVVAESSHEANAGPWHRLREHGFEVHNWRVRGDGCELDMEQLQSLLSERTRIVALPHVSNILGRVEDVRGVADLAHQCGARVVVDGVAYAPHRAIDVGAAGADWYAYSTYKVLGPHMAAMWGRSDAVAELEGPNHFFIPRDETPYKFEPGGVSHEGCAGIVALWEYLAAVAGESIDAEPRRETIERAFERFTEVESVLAERLLNWLATRTDVHVIGPAKNSSKRVSTVSFVHATRPSAEVVRAVNQRGFGIRFGHFYAHRLCERLALEGPLHDVEDGVIRVSPLHYNTLEEIDGLIRSLDEVMK